MTTFALGPLVSTSNYLTAITRTLTVPTSGWVVGDWIIAIMTSRGGTYVATSTIDDDQAGDWTLLHGVENRPTDAQKRISQVAWMRQVTAADVAAGSLDVTCYASGGYFGSAVTTLSCRGGYIPTVAAAAGAGSGTAGLDGISTPDTPAIQDSDLLLLGTAGTRPSQYTFNVDVSFLEIDDQIVEYYDPDHTYTPTVTVGIETTGQPSGIYSLTAIDDGLTAADNEGVVMLIVFKDGSVIDPPPSPPTGLSAIIL